MDVVEIPVNPRESFGKAAQKVLRNKGRIPAVVYGSGSEAKPLEVDAIAFARAIAGNAVSQIYKLTSEDKGSEEGLTLIREVQRASLSEQILHIDFYRLSKGTRIDVTIPLVLEGESPALKVAGCILNQTAYDVDVKCIPSAIPEKLVLDISSLEEGTSLHLSDLNLPEGVELKSDPSLSVVSVIVKKIEEEPEVVAEGADAAEGAAPAAEGAAAAPADKADKPG